LNNGQYEFAEGGHWLPSIFRASANGNIVMTQIFTNPDIRLAITSVTFLSSYLVFAIGRFPGTRINRTAMAIIGAALMFAFRCITPAEGIHSIDFRTIVLLFSMMLIVASLHLAGFFEWITSLVIDHLAPRHLLPSVIFTSGILSAFLVNDVVCLFMAPLILQVCRRLSKPAGPYLLALATASNIGSAATFTGNPQNILIGSLSGIPYRDFFKSVGPVAFIGLFIAWGVLHWLYPNHTAHGASREQTYPSTVRSNGLFFPVAVTSLVLAGFLAGLPPALVAILGGAVLLIRRSEHPERVYNQVDWSLLILFIGLFLIIGAAEASGIARQMLAFADRLNLQNVWILSGVIVALSNLVSNVPAVMLLKGILPQFHDPRQFWLLLSVVSTLAGNLTITGSVANIIVIEKARAETPISFTEYLRVGIPITVATVLVGVLWIRFVA
jgi:Na+/H+ antiporter NhaD/arsenite permease-like protein